MDKKLKKLLDKKCCICEENQCLDVHRLTPGKDGGKYVEGNCVTICPNCHRKCHSGIIKIVGKYYCTSGRYIIKYIENEEEKMKEL